MWGGRGWDYRDLVRYDRIWKDGEEKKRHSQADLWYRKWLGWVPL